VTRPFIKDLLPDRADERYIGTALKKWKEAFIGIVHTGDLHMKHPTNGAEYVISEERDHELHVTSVHSGGDLALVMVRRGSIAYKLIKLLGR
jgi:hypothetical protein